MDVSAGLTLAETVRKTLGSPIWTKIESMWGLESELDKLKDTISTIEAVLLDADEEDIHQQQHRSHVVRNRLQRLREALYRADDLIDEIATLAHRNKLISGNKVSRELCVFFSCSNQLRSAYNWSEELKRIREMLDDIVKDHRFEFGQRHPVALEPWRMMKMRHNPRETHSYCEESDIIGREDDKKKVIDMLLGSTSVEKNVSVISIVGIGGLGKTTLAQLVYNDAKIKTEFPLRMWVCVSDDFNVGSLLQQIIAAARNDEKELNMPSMDKLQRSLGEALSGKKYLLVLDDIWNEEYHKWNALSVLLEKGGSGSKIMVTTRSNRVADVVGSRKIHELRGLSDHESWKLFERIAFEGENNHTEDEIGKEILSKCRNVPLAIRVVGSLLRGQDRRTWEYIKNTDLVNIEQDDNGILPVLKISYYHLPFHLKSCFSYCAVFPKDYKIVKDDLIHLWMAQGFVMPLVGQSLEDAGEKYFNHLLQRCFFQDVEKDSSGEIISCKMHDLIHDVAKEVAGTEILSSNNNTNHFNESTRHFFIDHNTIKVSDDIVSSFSKMKRMRSLLSNDISSSKWESSFRSIMKLLLSEVRYLRVLDLHRIRLFKVPNVIGQLMHLRYLDLSHHDELTMLPESISKLYNLQTLKLRHCDSLKTLPRDLSKLVNLRNLDIFGCTNLRYMPPGMNKMTSLQKLTRFVMRGTRKTSQWRSHCVGELVDLVNFTNHADILQILVRKFVRYNPYTTNICGNLLSKHLRKIEIKWEDNDVNDDSEENNNAKVSLKGLESCHMLSKIYLQGILRLEHLPPLHQLRQLKMLTLFGLRNLKYVDKYNISEDGAKTEELLFFPSLEKLELINLPKFKGWWKTTSESNSGKVDTETSNGDKKKQKEEAQYNQLTTTGTHFNSYLFPRLSCLVVNECPSLTAIPWGPNVVEMTMRIFDVRMIVYPVSFDYKKKVIDVGSLNYEFHHFYHLEINFDYTTSLPIGMEFPSDYLPRGMMEFPSDYLPRGMMVFLSDCLCSLRSLTISHCRKLKRLSCEGFWEHCTALQTLKLIKLDELELGDEKEEVKSSSRDGDEGEIRKEVTPWRFLSHSLRNLTLYYLPKLEKLPNGMRHLTSLQSLQIKDCRNLKSMSEEMRHLTSLQLLTLEDNSAELNERCKKPSGADWPNIQHIPRITIEVYDDTTEQYSPIQLLLHSNLLGTG